MEFKTIGGIFGENYYAIPDYQRDYEWTNVENQTLLDDIMSLLFEDEENHFMGAIVTVPYEKETGTTSSISFSEYKINEGKIRHLVDGQQRLTSLSALCIALYELIDEDDTLEEDDKEMYFFKRLQRVIYGDNYKGKSPAPRLILNSDSGKYYNNGILHITSDNPKMIYKGPRRLKQAFISHKTGISTYREDFIENRKFRDNEEFYTKLLNTIMDRIIFVDIQCDKAANAFQVFDSLNGKGLDLTAADRIKNIFVSWMPTGKGIKYWNKLVELVHEDYLVNYFVSEFFYIQDKRISKNNLPKEFKNYFYEAAKDDYDEFFNILEKDGEYYGKLRLAKTKKKELDVILNDFSKIKQDQAYVLLFAAYKRFYGTDKYNDKQFVEFAKELFALTVRMQVCEKSTNKLDSIFTDCIKKIKADTATLSMLTQAILTEKQKIVSDKEFQFAFSRFAPKENGVSEVYLRHIENALRKKNKNRVDVAMGLTVEHIIPEEKDPESWYGDETLPMEVEVNFKEEYVQSIGNKMLLYGDDNTSAGNNNYDDKKKTYNEGKRGQDEGTPVGTFEMVKDLLNKYPDKFNHEEVMNRAAEMAGIAVELW